ncbi:hypothetical protein [Bradyrhizobium sp. STM 3566]
MKPTDADGRPDRRENQKIAATAIAPILCDQDEFGKTIGESDLPRG